MTIAKMSTAGIRAPGPGQSLGYAVSWIISTTCCPVPDAISRQELRVAASLLALRSAYGGTIHIGGACGGSTPRGKSANHSCVATQSEPLRMDAIRDEVQLMLIRRVG